jgi:para-nitrobenzyl esterase
MNRMIGALAGAVLTLGLAGAAQAAEVKVKVESGTLVGAEEAGIRTFRGIPYAKPPVGDLR